MSPLASWLKERAIFHGYRICKGKALFCFKVEKQGIYLIHSCLKRAVSLHGFKNEAYFVYTALVWGYHKTSDSDGHEWTLLGSHGPRRIPFDKCVSADTIGQHFCPLWFSSDFRYSFASNVSYIRWKVLRIEFCLFHRKKYISYGCVLEMYGKKSISTLPNRKLGKCNEIRNNRNLISGEV